MSDKLQNIKAVTQLLSGTHKTQTKTQLGYTGTTKSVKHEIGDVWEEVHKRTGAVYIIEQKNGFRTRTPKNSVIDKLRQVLTVPDTCPGCGTKMRGREKKLNFKFWFMKKKCFGCVLTDARSFSNCQL